MPSTPSFLHFVLEQLSSIEYVSTRPMMGEYLLYFKDKLAGGIYDDRLLLKPVPAALAAYPDAPMEEPYPGAKCMLMVENVEDGDALVRCLEAMYDDLPAPKKKAPKKPRSKTASK